MVAQDASGNAQPQVSVLQGIVTPNTQPPTFLFLKFTAPVVDQNTGFFAINMSVNTSVAAKIYYSIYRFCSNLRKLCQCQLMSHCTFVHCAKSTKMWHPCHD